MFKKLIALALVAATVPFASDAGYVKGYYRKNGTYVAPHYSKTSKQSYSEAISKTERSAYTSAYAPGDSSSRPKASVTFRDPYDTRGARTFSKGMKQRKYIEQGGVCPHCRKHCQMSEMEGDHITPYSKGGKTDYSNLQMLCAPCNRRKGNRYSY